MTGPIIKAATEVLQPERFDPRMAKKFVLRRRQNVYEVKEHHVEIL
jgi:hypothetical protein